jgi:hypothetical protein
MSIFSSSPKLPSERRFGLTFTIALAGLALYEVIRHRSRVAVIVCAVASVVFALFTLFAPRALAPLNRLWLYFGELLGKIVSPIVLGVIFFGILTPLSALLRLLGRDELQLKRSAAKSYWIDHAPTASIADSFKNQF